VNELAAVAPRRSLTPERVLAVGVAVVYSAYLWSDTWAPGGFDLFTAALDLYYLLPYVVLALATRWRRAMGERAALWALVTVSAGTVAAQLIAGSDSRLSEVALVAAPPLLAAVVVTLWGLEARGVAASPPAGSPRPIDSLRRLGALGVSDRLAFGLLFGGFVLLVGGRLSGLREVAAVENFVVIFTSIVVEALPFILLGALVSALLEVFVPDRLFARVAGLPLQLQVPGAVLGGFAFPVCECGSVPVARRLISKGVHPAAGLAFMLASPILNPIVLISTVVAYQGRAEWEMLAGRAGLGLLLAATAGVLLGRGATATILRARPGTASGHVHHHGGRLRSLTDHLGGDFLFMGKFVVAGGALAAALQTAVPQSVFTGILAAPLVATLVMMVLAFILSLCSEADAFVAVSFVQFPLSAQLGFLVFGPVIDLKLALLYGATFGRAFVIRVTLVSAVVTILGTSVFHMLTT